MVRPRSAVPVALAVALAASACTTSSGSSSGDTGTVRFAVTSDAQTFDPARGRGATDYTISRLQFSTLVRLAKDGTVLPHLAEKWDVSADSATFTLRKGLTCSDGQPLEATEVAASLERFADPKQATSQARLAFGPKLETTITADDAARTVSIKLGSPWSDMLRSLAQPNAGIVCEPGLKDPDALAKGPVKGAGSGPYTLTDVQRGRGYTLKLREGFNAWTPYKDEPEGKRAGTLKLSVVSNESTAANQLSTGAIDYAAFTGPDAARFANGPYKLRTAPLLRMFIMFNEREGHPGADPKVREAVARALDPKAFNKVYGGKGEVMLSYTDSTSPCVNKDPSLVAKTDPAAARKVLDGIALKLTGTNAVAGGAGNSYVQEALRAAGADVKLRNVDNATWATEVIGNKGDWDLTVMAHLNFSGTLTDGATRLTGPPPPEGGNFGDVRNKGFDAGMGQALATTDETAKCAAWQSAQKALLERHDVVPLATVPVVYVTGDGVDGQMSSGALDPSSFRIKG